MPDRIDYLIEKYFMQGITAKTESKIGVEIELPIVRLNKKPLEIEFAVSLMEHMNRHGFISIDRTIDGYCYKAKNKYGDVLSFDTTWNIIEFSMKQETAITAPASRFYEYIRTAQRFAQAHGYIVCGRGLHPYAEHIDITPLNTNILRAKSDFLKNFTSHQDGDVFFAIPASTQTHIDCPPAEFLDVLNFLRRFIFIDACLFANSLPPSGALIKKHPVLAKAAPDTYCYRDEIYKLSEAPNTYPCDREFNSFADIKNYLRGLNVFIVTDGKNDFKPIVPTSFETYFNNEEHPEEDIVCFRPLEPVSVSRYGTFELRGTCTQPLFEIFQPTAFYTGLVQMRNQATELLDEFLEEQRIHMTPMELRRKFALGEAVADEGQLQSFLKRLVVLAYKGLSSRDFSEEKVIKGLYDKAIQSDTVPNKNSGRIGAADISAFQTPARREKVLREAGIPLLEIIQSSSELHNS